MISAYDRWATKEGPDFAPYEVSADEWLNDKDVESFAPFDETICDAEDCDEIIGAHLYMDPETTADIPTFTPFWVMDEDCEILFCESCWYFATKEIE
jgi:hypothetical protein